METLKRHTTQGTGGRITEKRRALRTVARTDADRTLITVTTAVLSTVLAMCPVRTTMREGAQQTYYASAFVSLLRCAMCATPRGK